MILIIDKSKANAKRFADSLYYLGIPTLALTPSEAFTRVSTEFRAIIILNPDTLADVDDYIRRIKSYVFNTPIFTIFPHPSRFEYSYLFDGVYQNISVSELLFNIREYCKRSHLKPPGDFKISGIDVSVSLKEPTFLWNPIYLTKTEKMILRVFIACYPRTLSAKEILALAFKKSRVPELSNVRAHICIIDCIF